MLNINTLLDITTLFGLNIFVHLILIIICGFPTYYISLWFLKEYLKVDKVIKTAIWPMTIILTPWIYYSFFIFGVNFNNNPPQAKFNKEKWFANKQIRHELVNDIIETKMLIGKTKAEVRQILGDDYNKHESLQEYYFAEVRQILDKDNKNEQSLYWTYDLGNKTFNRGYLGIIFKDEKVIKAEWFGVSD